MSSKLQFLKLKILSQEVTEAFSMESIHQSLQALLKGTEQKSTEYIEKYFEDVASSSVQVDISQIQKIIPTFSNDKTYNLFDPNSVFFFMVYPDSWNAIQKIVAESIKDMLEEDEIEAPRKLENICRISKDYTTLSDIYKQKLLFATIF